jgi:hypothetical protein
MTFLTPWALRLFGLAGIIGSILFMWGDLSYNHIPGVKDSPARRMSGLPEKILLRAGMLGLFGCWFYSLAALHVFLAFQPAGQVFAFILALVFGATMIGYGIAHTAYFSIATGAQTAVQLGSDAETGGKLGSLFFQRLTKIIYLPVVVFSLMMIYAILTRHSLYPLWMVAFIPTVLYLIKALVIKLLKGRPQQLIADSYDNLILFVFFVLSTLVLWNA